MLMFGSFSQVAQAAKAPSGGEYSGYVGKDGALKIGNHLLEEDGYCINIHNVFPGYGKEAKFEKLSENDSNLFKLVKNPAENTERELLVRVKQVLKYAEDHKSEIERELARPSFGISNKLSYYLAVQGAIWSLTDKDVAGKSINLKIDNWQDRKRFNAKIQEILKASISISHYEYSYISIGIYKAKNPRLQNIITREKPKFGAFQVKKLVEGLDENIAKNKDFNFDYKCTDNAGVVKSGRVTVKGDGKPVFANDLFEIGSECTVAEADGAEVDGYKLTITPDKQTFTIGEIKPELASFVNKYEKTEEGSFKVQKFVFGTQNGDGKNKDFEFSYACGNKTGVVKAKGNGDLVEVGKFPIGTACTVKEVGNTDIEGYKLIIKAKETKVVLGKNKANVATLNNHYEKVKPEKATFRVKKTVTGLEDEVAKAKQFEFSYVCTDGQKGSVVAKGDGKAVAAGKNFPVGTKCVVEETGNADVEGYTLVKPTKQTLTIGDRQSVEFAFVNEYTKVKPVEGTFQVKKTVAGLADESGKDKQFKFSYTCGDKTGNLTVKGDGKPVVAKEKFPVGTSCTVTENVEAAKVDGYTLKVTEPKQKTVKVAEGKTVEFAFVNTYAPEEAKVTFSKVVAGQGKELAGASLKIVEGEKADGKVVYEWTSEGKAKVFGLKSGVYTMVEDQAPLGFEKAEAITFRVSFDKNGGKVEVKQGDKFVAAKDAKVVMEDKPSLTPEKPKLSKTGLEIGALGIVSLVLIAAGSVIIRRKKTL
ncbi:DUF5979 domain-containing protein [Arcanobacterium phocae]|nr:DUF5979 domain-containing protein [Arcanobacterium phocae]